MFEKFADEILPRNVFKIPIIWLIHHNVTTSHRNDNDRYVMLINDHDMICHHGEILLCLKLPQWSSYETWQKNLFLILVDVDGGFARQLSWGLSKWWRIANNNSHDTSDVRVLFTLFRHVPF